MNHEICGLNVVCVDKYKEKIFNYLWNGIRVLRMEHKPSNDSAQVHKVMFEETDVISYSLDLLPIPLLQHLYFQKTRHSLKYDQKIKLLIYRTHYSYICIVYIYV